MQMKIANDADARFVCAAAALASRLTDELMYNVAEDKTVRKSPSLTGEWRRLIEQTTMHASGLVSRKPAHLAI